MWSLPDVWSHSWWIGQQIWMQTSLHTGRCSGQARHGAPRLSQQLERGLEVAALHEEEVGVERAHVHEGQRGQGAADGGEDAHRVGPRSQQNGEDKRAAKLRHPRSNVLEVAELNEVWRQAGNGAAQRQANQAEYGQEESRAIVSQPTERHS